MGPMLWEWHLADPADDEKCRRTAEILTLQDTNNSFLAGCN